MKGLVPRIKKEEKWLQKLIYTVYVTQLTR
jgi:hypothetical protein